MAQKLSHHIWLSLDISTPLFEESILTLIGEILVLCLPQWCEKLRASRDEFDRNPIRLTGTQKLSETVLKCFPFRFGVGDITLRGSYQRVKIYLSHSSKPYPPCFNNICVEIFRRKAVEGESAWLWSLKFVETACEYLPVYYAKGYAAEEYDSKNMDFSGGARAIGVNRCKHLPGIYWLNYFGKPYASLMNADRLSKTPAHLVKQLRDGFLIVLSATGDVWSTNEYKITEQATLTHIGKQFFFSRDDPNRIMTGPDFFDLEKQRRKA